MERAYQPRLWSKMTTHTPGTNVCRKLTAEVSVKDFAIVGIQQHNALFKICSQCISLQHNKVNNTCQSGVTVNDKP